MGYVTFMNILMLKYLAMSSASLCQLELSSKGLYIIPEEGQSIHLQRTSDSKTILIQKRQLLKADSRSNMRFALHLDDMSDTHPVWIFNW